MFAAIDAASIPATNPSSIGGTIAPFSFSPARQSTNAPDAPFADLLPDAVGHVNELERQARIAVDGLMTGSGVDVHQAVIATEKASMSFELALAVRNKAVQAYQSVMAMQF